MNIYARKEMSITINIDIYHLMNYLLDKTLQLC